MCCSLSPAISELLSPHTALPEPMSPVAQSSSSEEGDSGSDSSESDSSSEVPPAPAPAMPPTTAPLPPVEEPAPARWNLERFLTPTLPAPHSDTKPSQVQYAFCTQGVKRVSINSTKLLCHTLYYKGQKPHLGLYNKKNDTRI